MIAAAYHFFQGVLTSEEIAGICAALVALAVPINTALLFLLNRRQKAGNHHTETIRDLAHTLNGAVTDLPPEELGERVAEAAAEADAPVNLPPSSSATEGPHQI